MPKSLYDAQYNPDILSCLANLSNDEVFTPPVIANQMLDMLPQELFKSPDTKFLDPACKSGVFLREIAKRLIEGEAEIYPDLQERIDHIMHEQLYGIAITELTSLMSRRSVYCSKYPNGIFSISKFDEVEGNIRFKGIQHLWENGKCKYCGAPEEQYSRGDLLESHAYEFIHTSRSEEILNMKFDVIISNPPYQLNDGGGMGTSAKPIYQLFVEQAQKLKPRYLSMIIPSRWFAGGKGLDDFRDNVLHDNHFRKLVDYFNATDCFPGVDISGGICYFLWDRDNGGECEVVSNLNGNTSHMIRSLTEGDSGTFVRFNEAVPIVRKIMAKNEESFSTIVSTRRPFNLNPDDVAYTKDSRHTIATYAYPKNGYVSPNAITAGREWVKKYKVYISKAYGERGNFPYLVTAKPFIGEPNSVCTETYLVVGATNDEKEAINIQSYMATKFFRFLVLLKKNTQNAPKGVYDFVPLQNFSKAWTDEELYKKYNLSTEEIAFVESMVRPMELNSTEGDD